jgi:hypothetical protein
MLARDLPFHQIFSSIVRPVVSEEKDKLLAIASMDELSKFIPAIDVSRNIDLLPIAFDACVVNRGNKNGDMIDTDTGLATYKTFIHKFIDTEHNRQKVIGVILTASLSEFGTNKLLTEDDVKGSDKPFNITLGGVLWKAVNGDLCDLVEDSNDPDSDNYRKVSASWELGFSGYSVVELEQGEKSLSKGKVITDPDFIKKIEKYLKCFGGSGVKDGKSYYRMPNENVIAMGIGLTEKPAAEVQGIAVNTDAKPALAEAALENTEASVEKNNNAKAEIISQSQENNVKRERESNMKITSIADITDESLKQCSASVVTDFIKSELQKANDTFITEKANQATAAQKLQETTQSLAAKLDEMKASLEALAKEKADRERVDAFNSRMSEIVASYELPDDVSKIVVEEIKGLGTAEAYAAWQTKAATLFKPYSKTAIAAAKQAKADEEAEAKKKEDEAKAKFVPFEKKGDKKDDKEGDKDGDDKKDDKKKDAKASEAIASVVDAAIDNADKKDAGLPNSTSAVAQGLKEKFKNAFASENFVIKQ